MTRYFYKLKKAIEKRKLDSIDELLSAEEVNNITQPESKELFDLAFGLIFDRRTIDLLLDRLPTPDLTTLSEGMSSAIFSNNFTCLECLLEFGVSPNNSAYPLHRAIYWHDRHNTIAINLLLRYGADVNFPDDLDNTPLLDSLVNGLEDIALKLIKLGADIQLGNRIGLMPFHAAYNNQLPKILDLFRKTGTKLNFSLSPPPINEHRDLMIAEHISFLTGEYNDGYDDRRLAESKILINFFSLDADKQIEIMPTLDRIADFTNSQGDVFTDNFLEGLVLGLYPAVLDRLSWSIVLYEEPENNYSELNYPELNYAIDIVRTQINRVNELFSPTSLKQPQWTLVRMLSRYIRDYLDIEINITAADMQRIIPPYVNC